MLLSDKYEFLTNYFESGIKNDSASLSHSILFYGNDLESQYIFAKEIARLLNCSQDYSDDCKCTNCKWIKEDKHPAVMIISRIDNKPDGDNTKTTISVKQAEMIRNMLIKASDFHRVFIFCDKDEKGNIRGLNSNNFQEEAANSLLKIIEEPTERVTFIFLTQDKSNILSTIVSRSQCFFLPTKVHYKYDFDLIKDTFNKYWTFDRGEVFNISEKLTDLSNENGIDKILIQLQNYMTLLLKNNPQATVFINHIKLVEEAKRKAGLGIKSDIIFDELCLKLIH